MYELLEYFYCLIYVSSLTFCVYKYLDRKPKWKELVVFLLMYGFVNYIITGKIIIDIKYRIVIDFLSILNDFIFICLLNKKIELYLFVYVTLFSTIYLQSVVLILDLINQIDKYYVLISLEPSFLRFMLVILFNIITVVIYKILEKKDFIVTKKMSKTNYKVLCAVNALVIFVMIIFQWINTTQNQIFIHLISLLFVIMWLILLHVLKKSFELTEYKENQIVVQSIYSNINENINRITYEQENIKKIRHDLKNHLVIIKSMDKDEHLSQYLDQLYSKIDNVKIGHEVITGNVYVDTIINSKISEYCNVSLTYDCSIDGLKLKPIDLSMLLFNLLDNACHSASEVNGFVDLKMNYIGNHLFIEVKNDFKEKPNFISKKGVGHGYGMRIINDIVEEYYGEIEYKVLENEVNVKVGLNIED